MFRRFLIVISITTLLGSCTGSTWQLTSEDTITVGKTVQLTAVMVRTKPRRVDVRTSIKNLSNENILILLNDGSCSRNNVLGQLQYGKLNIGERLIDIPPQQIKIKNFSCMFQSDVESGDVTIQFSHVYNNPSGDRATLGKAIENDIKWVLKDR